MTAEIAVMNREGIALAADSAVTTRHASGQKIFVSANKIFALSKYFPVAVMIYGNAQFMAVPWETIIKTYRRRLGSNEFSTLKEHAQDFLLSLERDAPILFSAGLQDAYIEAVIRFHFNRVRSEITDAASKQIAEKGAISEDETKVLASTILKFHHDGWQKAAKLSVLPDGFEVKVVEKYKTIIDQVRVKVFEKLVLPDDGAKLLEELGGSVLAKSFVSRSGVVVAGYGRDEIFPSLYSFELDGILINRLKYKEIRERKITHETGAWIVPLAQREMVDTFMEGIDPMLSNEMNEYIAKIISDYPALVIDSVGELTEERKAELKAQWAAVVTAKVEECREEFQRYRREKFVNPVINVVRVLPKDELAALAESFVNLTSLKRRVSLEEETVGGPIDVAVLSKGDGFIWIKRKHYFSRDLNPQFFATYFQEATNDDS